MGALENLQLNLPKSSKSGGAIQKILLEQANKNKPKTNVFSNFIAGNNTWEATKQTFLEGHNTQKSFLKNGIYTFRDSSTNTWKLLFDTMDVANEKFTKGVSDLYGKDRDAWTRWQGATEAGLGLATAAFAPISTLLKGVEGVPVVGYVAAGVNSIFAGIAQGAGDAAAAALYSTNLSEETKKKLEPTVREASGLVAQIAAGYKTAKYTEAFKVKTKEIIDVAKQEAYVAQNFINTRNLPVKFSEPTKIPIERYYDEGNMPTIEWGKPATSDLPSIQFGDTTTARPPFTGTRYVAEKPFAKDTSQPTGTEFQSRTGLKIAQEQGMASDVVPWQQRRPNQFESADAFVASDPVLAERSLKNPDLVPQGLYVQEVYGSLRKKYDAEGNYVAAERLIESGIPTETARQLQVLNRNRAFNPEEVSLTDAIQEIKSGLQIRAEKEAKVNVQEMSQKVKAAGEVKAPKLKTWDEFIKSLEC